MKQMRRCLKINPLFAAAIISTSFCVSASARDANAVASALKIHPKVFSMIDCWISDSEAPIVTEINLDATDADQNQFNPEEIKKDGAWIKSPGPDGQGFLRYRVLEQKGNHYKIEHQENGGGSLTTSVMIEFSVEKRQIHKEGKPKMIRVLRVLSLASK